MSSVKIATKPDLREQMFEVGRAARAAAEQLAEARADVKRAALEAAAKELRASAKTVLRANADDVADAKSAGLSSAMIDRLALNEKRIEAIAAGLEDVAALAGSGRQRSRAGRGPTD